MDTVAALLSLGTIAIAAFGGLVAIWIHFNGRDERRQDRLAKPENQMGRIEERVEGMVFFVQETQRIQLKKIENEGAGKP